MTCGDELPTVRVLRPDQLHEAAALLTDVFGAREAPMAPDLLRALVHAGGYVAGATATDGLVGVGVGFRGVDDGQDVLHSHVVGVLPAARGHGVGEALKRHQRAWAAAAGLTAVTWTFDPLQRGNARFNLSRLGASVTGFSPDFYGALDDGLNDGDLTDRLHVRWPTTGSAGGGAVPTTTDAAIRYVATPPDANALRRDDPAGLRRWRLAVRSALEHGLAAGLSVRGIDADGRDVLAGSP